jgi:hypothetical protein
MNKSELLKLLPNLFYSKKIEDEVERICFTDSYMNRENINEYAIYKAVSEAQHNSGLTFDFSYEVASRAVDVITTLIDQYDDDLANLEDSDNITEAVDGIIPVSTHDLMQIYQSNSWLVDEARQELGNDGDTTQQAQQAWYKAINDMVHAIIPALQELIDEEEVDHTGQHDQKCLPCNQWRFIAK